jgi:hypothetical protein
MHLQRTHETTTNISRIQSFLSQSLFLLAPFCAEAELDAGLHLMLTRVADPSSGAKIISTLTFQQHVAVYCA